MKFQKNYENQRIHNAANYEKYHRHDLSNMKIAHSDVLLEVQITGEIFPGRPEVRPRIDLGATANDENTCSCFKHYVTSNTHSLGIFTVQCACPNAKLLGFSLMVESEWINIDLSVLLSRFKLLPQMWYYDNGSNMSKPILLQEHGPNLKSYSYRYSSNTARNTVESFQDAAFIVYSYSSTACCRSF